MLAKSGDALLSPQAVTTLRERLLPRVSLITPNLPEAAALLETGHARDEQEMKQQGRALLALGCEAVLIKGGISAMPKARTGSLRAGEQRFTAPRIATRNTHGTGCTLSSALAALRPRHADWESTIAAAKARLRRVGAGRYVGSRERHWAGAPFLSLVVGRNATFTGGDF